MEDEKINSIQEIKHLAGLFQNILENSKTLPSAVCELVNQTNKLESQLRSISRTFSSVIEVFNNITNTVNKGSSKDIGVCLSNIYVHNKSIETYLANITNSISSGLNGLLKSKNDEFRRNLQNLEKDHSREFKKSRNSIKKKLEMILKLEKKIKRESASPHNMDEIEKLTGLLCSTRKGLNAEYKVFQEQERQSLGRASLSERSYLCSLVLCIKPFLIQDIHILQEVSQLWETVQSLENICSDPEYLPFSSEQYIQDLRLGELKFSFETPSTTPRNSMMGSRCGSLRSLSSFTSSRPPSPTNTNSQHQQQQQNQQQFQPQQKTFHPQQHMSSPLPRRDESKRNSASPLPYRDENQRYSASPLPHRDENKRHSVSLLPNRDQNNRYSSSPLRSRDESKRYSSVSVESHDSAQISPDSGSSLNSERLSGVCRSRGSVSSSQSRNIGASPSRVPRSPNTAFSTVKRAHSPYRLKTLSNECRMRSNLANQEPEELSVQDPNGTLTRRPPIPRRYMPPAPARSSSLERRKGERGRERRPRDGSLQEQEYSVGRGQEDTNKNVSSLQSSVPGSDEDPYSTHINYSPAQAKPYGSPAHPPRGNSQPSQSSQPFQPSAQSSDSTHKIMNATGNLDQLMDNIKLNQINSFRSAPNSPFKQINAETGRHPGHNTSSSLASNQLSSTAYVNNHIPCTTVYVNNPYPVASLNPVYSRSRVPSTAIIHPFTPNYSLPRSLNISFSNQDCDMKSMDINQNQRTILDPDDLITPVVENKGGLGGEDTPLHPSTDDDITPTVEQLPAITQRTDIDVLHKLDNSVSHFSSNTNRSRRSSTSNTLPVANSPFPGQTNSLPMQNSQLPNYNSQMPVQHNAGQFINGQTTLFNSQPTVKKGQFPVYTTLSLEDQNKFPVYPGTQLVNSEQLPVYKRVAHNDGRSTDDNLCLFVNKNNNNNVGVGDVYDAQSSSRCSRSNSSGSSSDEPPPSLTQSDRENIWTHRILPDRRARRNSCDRSRSRTNNSDSGISVGVSNDPERWANSNTPTRLRGNSNQITRSRKINRQASDPGTHQIYQALRLARETAIQGPNTGGLEALGGSGSPSPPEVTRKGPQATPLNSSSVVSLTTLRPLESSSTSRPSPSLSPKPPLKRSQSLGLRDDLPNPLHNRMHRRSVISPDHITLASAIYQRMKQRINTLDISAVHTNLYHR